MARRLTDLYVKGKRLTFDDGSGEEIKVWLKKLMPFETEVAIARANAERAKLLTIKSKDDNDDEKVFYVAQIDEEWDQDQVVRFIAAEDVQKALRSTEAEVGSAEEWDKDDYLVSLQEAWDGGASDIHAAQNEDDPEAFAEAERVFAELKRFKDQVQTAFDKAEARIIREYGDKSKDEIREEGINRLIESHAELRWSQEFRRSEIWLAVRDPEDHTMQYFARRVEVDQLAVPVLARLLQEYRDLELTSEEGKG